MLLSLSIGLLGLSFYISFATGWVKVWLITRPMGTMFHPRMAYMMLPIGIAFTYGSFMPLLPNYTPESIYLYIFIALQWIGFLFLFWAPPFLTPRWVKLLEQDYGYCLPILIEEARKMGRWKWNARVRTPAQLQSWIDEVMSQHQDEIDQLWHTYRSFMQEEFGKGNFYIPQHRRKQ